MSDDTPRKRGPGRPPKITVVPRADESQWSVEDVNRRRLDGEPFGLVTSDIPLREKGMWSLRIANSQSDEGRHYKMRHRLGWEPAVLADLAEGVTPESIGFRLAEDGQTLCRGIRGDEVLYKKPKAIDQAIQMKKAEANTKGLKSERAAKEDTLNAAALSHGSEAAEFLARHATISIKDSQQPL